MSRALVWPRRQSQGSALHTLPVSPGTQTSDGKQSDVNVQTPSLVQWFSVRGLWPVGVLVGVTYPVFCIADTYIKIVLKQQ